MFFMKGKKRDADRKQKPDSRKAPSPKQEPGASGEPRRRPPEQRKRPPQEGREAAPEQRKRRPPQEGRETPPEQRKRRPPQEGRETPPEQRKRRPPQEGREAPPEQRKRRPPQEGREAPPEQRKRRPPQEEREAAPEQRKRRPPQEGREVPPEQRRRRPPQEEREVSPEQLNGPEETLQEDRSMPETENPEAGSRPEPREEAAEAERRPAPDRPEPRRRRPEEKSRRRAPEERRPRPESEDDDTVFQMENAPRRNAPARKSRADRKAPARRPATLTDDLPGRRFGSMPSLRDAPQGTSYKRQGARARKSFIERYFPSRAGKDPELVADEARMKLMQRDEVDEKKKKRSVLLDTPAIIYTQPKPFNRNRLLVQLITVLAVAVAFVMGLSIFFKVKVITISGAETYSPWAIREASGIMEGDNLLTFGRARASGLITANLPYVESVRIGIKLPDTVNIEVKELDVVYSIRSGDGDWWLMTSTGKVVKQINAALAKEYTKVLGVTLDKPVVGQQGMAVEAVPEGTAPAAETAPVTITGAQRLNAAMEILTALENNDIVGDAASVDVTNLDKIELWYGQRYQVNLGDESRLEEKVDCMYDVILQLSDYQTGMLDISFTKKADQVIYTPFV